MAENQQKSSSISVEGQIADQIRKLPEGAAGNTLKILLELSKSDQGGTYWACKKYLEEKGSNFDGGFVGLSDRFLGGKDADYVVAPMDIVLYATPIQLKTGDIVQTIYLDKGNFGLYHFRIRSFNLNGMVELEDLLSGKTWPAGKNSLLGKIAKVIRFNESEWNELIPHLAPRQWIIDILLWHLKSTEEGSLSDKERRIDELKRRIAALTAPQL